MFCKKNVALHGHFAICILSMLNVDRCCKPQTLFKCHKNQTECSKTPGRRSGTPPLFSAVRARASALPTFLTGGDASPTPPHFFGLKFVQKLVHCCNQLLTETQCKIISVQHVRRPKLSKKSLSKSGFRRPPLLF